MGRRGTGVGLTRFLTLCDFKANRFRSVCQAERRTHQPRSSRNGQCRLWLSATPSVTECGSNPITSTEIDIRSRAMIGMFPDEGLANFASGTEFRVQESEY